jgi:hypothetical protein
MIWPILTAIVHSLDKKHDELNLYHAYIQFIVVTVSLPALFGAAGTEGQIVATAALVYILKILPEKESNSE